MVPPQDNTAHQELSHGHLGFHQDGLNGGVTLTVDGY